MVRSTNEIVCVLMATFNGEKYIEEQIDSILRQTYKNWHLYIRDDGSTDRTIKLIEQYERKDSRIHILPHDGLRLKPCGSFKKLMNFVNGKYKYYMFSDQDDIWEIKKVEKSIEYMLNLERENKLSPCLAYCMHKDVNQNLDLLSDARQPYSSINLFQHLCVQNWILGCEMIFNQALMNDSHNIPKEAENHDYWVALVAALNGKIGLISETLILHRIHSDNVTTSSNTKGCKAKLNRIFFKNSFKDNRKNKLILCDYLKSVSKNEDSKAKVELYRKLLELKGVNAVWFAKQNEFRAIDTLHTIYFYMKLM